MRAGCTLALLIVLAPAGASAQAVPPASPASSPGAILNQYCVTCHNQRLKTAGLALEALDPAQPGNDAETWEKVVRKLRLGVMPPQGARRPDPTTYDSLIGWLEGRLDQAAAGHPRPGRSGLHRLNRAEYANAIRDLLGLAVDVTALLPPDNAAFGFDNVAEAQGNSPALLQAYLSSARKISAIAVGNPGVRAGSDTYSVRQDLSQDQHLDGLPLGTVGGMVARPTFPVDGDYEFQVRLYRTNLSAMRGLQDTHQVELTLDGERILLAAIGGEEDLVALQKNPTATSDAIEARRLRIRVPVKAGVRELGAAFLGETPSLFAASRLRPYIRDFANPYAAEGAPHVQSITVVGPFNAVMPAIAPSPTLFVCRPVAPARERECARRIVSTLARRAFRRPVPSTEVEELLAFYDAGRSGGRFETGVELVVRRILASPSFVFRAERAPSGLSAGTAYGITDFELASRLSFFLWSSIPDEELLRQAGSGRLGQPSTLVRQVQRMLSDPRSGALVTNFAGQWLQLRNLRGIVPNSEAFPDFDDNLRQAFRREAELFFDSVVHENRNVLDLMTADDTFVNERLARHYGIPGVIGSHFRRVRLTDQARWGLIGKGGVLLVTSHATTTSPVLRGKWILENVLGAPPPPPPPDVPALMETGPGAPPRTMREQMERHRTNAGCAVCHKTIDPIGFALENFDVVGRWRTASDEGASLETADVLADGSKVDGPIALRQALLRRPDVFVQTLTEKLFVYALGRGLTYEDMPEVRRIVRDARRQDYRFAALVQGIVASAAFRMRMKEP